MDSDEVVHILKRRPTRSPAAENKPLSNQLDDEDEEVAIKKRPRRSCTPAKKTPSEIQQMLDEYLLGEEDAEEVSTETNKYQSAAPSSDIDQKFAELLG